MSIKAVVAAIVGAALGALAWALIASQTGYEIGFVAWGIGGAVGYAAATMGGRGTAMGFVCAGLTLVSIFAGKYLGMHLLLESELDAAFGQEFSREYVEAERRRILREESLTEMVTSNLNGIDILFAVLGVTTAFKLGSSGGSGSGRDYGARRRARAQVPEDAAPQKPGIAKPPPQRAAPAPGQAKPRSGPPAPVPTRRRYRDRG